MPQIYVIHTVHANGVIGRGWGVLLSRLIPIVEETWEIKGFNDVATTVDSPAIFTFGEKDVQIEIRYTAGEDEYDQGKPFDPSPEKQKKLIARIQQTWKESLEVVGCKPLSVSVWCKPHYNSVFEEFD